jgi:hypothetical protein
MVVGYERSFAVCGPHFGSERGRVRSGLCGGDTLSSRRFQVFWRCVIAVFEMNDTAVVT